MPRGKSSVLTDSKIENAPVGNSWDSRQAGLLVTTNKRGRKTFRVRYDLNSKQKFKTLSPDYPMLSLDAARVQAADIRERAKEGVAAPVGDALTVDKVAELFVDPRARKNTDVTAKIYPMDKCTAGYVKQWSQRFARAYSPIIGHLPPDAVPQRVLLDVIEDAIQSGASGEALALRMCINSFYKNLAYHRDFKGERLVPNPIAGQRFMEYVLPEKVPLTEEEMRTLYSDEPLYNAVIQLLLFSGQRIGRVLAMRWTDIEDGQWCVGLKGQMKAKKSAFYLPWMSEMEALVEPFRGNRSEYIFTLDGNQPISNSCMNSALKRLNTEWTPHILRHTFATHILQVTDAYNVALLLHHSSSNQMSDTTHQVYVHSQQIERKRKALQGWLDYLFNLRCVYEPEPAAVDYAVKCGVERGHFDAPVDPLEEVLAKLSEADGALLRAAMPKTRTLSHRERAVAMRSAAICTDAAYMQHASVSSAEMLATLSTKYHLAPEELQSIIKD